MSISHAIVFVPVVLALTLSAALVSMAFMGGAHSSGGANAVHTLPPSVTGYVANTYVNGAQETTEEAGANATQPNGPFPDEVPAG
jgi:hypothetical protein